MDKLEGKKILVTGGTGSIGREVVNQIFTCKYGTPKSVWIYSRDENKQFEMQKEMNGPRINYLIGDIRDAASVANAVEGMDFIIHTAAMKHVPACENDPMQSVLTNVIGTNNIIQAIRQHRVQVESVVAISTDKCCNPLAVMGMTKAIMERLVVRTNLSSECRFNCVRSGNVIGSQGSVVPIFKDQAAKGQNITVTGKNMTRFFISKERLATILLTVLLDEQFRGIVYVPRMPAIRIYDLAQLIVDKAAAEPKSDITTVGYRPGERTHEIIISKDESHKARSYGMDYVILPDWSPLLDNKLSMESYKEQEYSSKEWVVSPTIALGHLESWKIL